MSDKKHIDRLFQEKLKDFEAIPNDEMWGNIHDRLHKDKRKRRVIPLWWKVAGVAALLALLFTVGVKLTSDGFNSDTTNPVVDTENQSPIKPNESITSDLNNPIQSDSKNSNDIQNQLDNASNVANENSPNSEEVSNDNSGDASNGKSGKNQFNQKSSESNKTRIADNNTSGSNGTDSQDQLNSQNSLNKDRVSELSSKINDTSATKDAVASVSKNNENNSNQNNLGNKINTNEIDQMIKDSKYDKNLKVTEASEKLENIISEETKVALKKDKSIEDAIADANTEDEKEKEKKLNRWNISPNVAPVYFNSLGKGSTLDAQFVGNNNSTEVTLSYGVGGSYAINDRLKVRAGINKVDMGYNTNNVIAFRSIDASSQARVQLDNVDTNATADNLNFMSTETLNRSSTPEIINAKSKGSLNQRFGFIEVPLEAEYALINNKLGVSFIGGFSTLIVDNNEIYSVFDGTEMRIGEANNINNLSYSANFGLGINYNISEKIKVNVEPTFKYQINTFNNSSGDFQPYFIGIYTGLSYKF